MVGQNKIRAALSVIMLRTRMMIMVMMVMTSKIGRASCRERVSVVV